MAHEERIPGLTLHLESASLKDGMGILHLRASVNDENTWDEVVERIDGHRIYTEDNIAQVAFNFVKEDLDEKNKELERYKREAQTRIERLEAENSHLKRQDLEWANEVKRLNEQLEKSVSDAKAVDDRWREYTKVWGGQS